MRRRIFAVVFALITIIVAIAAFSLYQSIQQPRTVAVNQTTASSATGATNATAAPTAIPPTYNAPIVYRVVSEKANLSAEIVELYFSSTEDNWDVSRLQMFAGHLEGTPDFKHGGNFVLAGHVEMKDGSAGPFAQINKLATGDLITILSSKTSVVMQYKVTKIARVTPDSINEIRNHGYEELTLVTCDDWNATDRVYKTRLIVHARPA